MPPRGLPAGVVLAVRIVLELETSDPEALRAFDALSRAGVEVIWVTPSEGGADPPIVTRLRDALVSRGRRLEAAFGEATREAAEEHRRAGREP